ncbi:unnamed protein product [Rotaria sp. Silwood2]|nr:unnamed protein product [Rotaria sp. Silwood2]
MQSSFIPKDSESEEHKLLERRRIRFTNQPTSITNKAIQLTNETNQPLIGTCEKLEKNYLRLTSAPNPSTIRPLAILEQAFSFVLNKYKLNNDWSYISNQLKSIRQDLMVQSIRNDFSVLVYEENARIALEMSDLDQFIQCQTQLELLYDSGCNPTHLIEFLIYRLLYSLLLNDDKKANRILIEIDEVNISTEKSNNLNVVLDFCSSCRRKDYIQLFRLYKSLPRLACCLVNFFIDIYRKQMIQILIWGFAPTLPTDVVTTMLAYESNEICQERLSSLDEVELVINSKDKERIFYCSSRVELDKQRNKLMASIDKPVSTSPAFEIKTEQANSTTIRIRIIPNGYIGVNRIICHWSNNISNGQAVDLIIGVHTTKVDFRIENVSSNHLTIVIKHNNTGLISERLCSGHFHSVDNQTTLTAVRDIMVTSDQTILINHLRPSTQYKICLDCYYERTDHSFKKEICHTIKTKGIFTVDI